MTSIDSPDKNVVKITNLPQITPNPMIETFLLDLRFGQLKSPRPLSYTHTE